MSSSSTSAASSLSRLNLSHDPLLSVLRDDLMELQEEKQMRRHSQTQKPRKQNKAAQNGSHTNKHDQPSIVQPLPPPPLPDVYTLTPAHPSVPNHFKPTASFIASAATPAAANTLMQGKSSTRKLSSLQADGIQSESPRGPLIVFPSTNNSSNAVSRYKAHVYNNESQHINQKVKHAPNVNGTPISPSTTGVTPMEEKILDHFLTNEQKATRRKNQMLLTNSAIRDERRLKMLEEQEHTKLAEIEQQRLMYEERQAAHNYAQQMQFEQQQQYNEQLQQQHHYHHHSQPPSFPHYYQAPTYYQPHPPPILAPLISAPVPPFYDHHALSIRAEPIFSLGGDARRRDHMMNGVSLPPIVHEESTNNHPRPSPVPLHTVSNHGSRQSSDTHIIVPNSTTPPPPKVSALNVSAIEQSSGDCSSPVSDVHTRSTSHETTSASPSGESSSGFHSSTTPSTTTSPPNHPLPPPHPPHRHRRSDSVQSPTAAQKDAQGNTPRKPAHGRNVSMDNTSQNHVPLDVAELMQVHAELATLEPEPHPTALICDSQAVQTNAILAQEKPWLHYDPLHPSSVIHHEAQHLIDEMRVTPSPVHLHKTGAQATAAAIVRARQHSINVATPAPTPLPNHASHRQATSPSGSSNNVMHFPLTNATATAGSSPRRTSHRRSISHGGPSSHAQLSILTASGLSSPTAREGSPPPPMPERATSLDAVQARILTAQHMLDEALDAANKVQSASTIISPSGPPPTPAHGPATPNGRRASKVLHPRHGSLVGMGSLLGHGNNLSVPATPRGVHARRPSSSLMSSLIDDEFDNLVHESIEDRLESNRAEADPEYGRKRALLLAKGPKHSPKPEHDMATWAQLVHEHMVQEKKVAAEEAERKRKEDEERAKSMSNAPTPRRMQSFLFRAQSMDDYGSSSGGMGGADGSSPEASELNYDSIDSSRFHSLPDAVAEGDDEA